MIFLSENLFITPESLKKYAKRKMKPNEMEFQKRQRSLLSRLRNTKGKRNLVQTMLNNRMKHSVPKFGVTTMAAIITSNIDLIVMDMVVNTTNSMFSS